MTELKELTDTPKLTSPKEVEYEPPAKQPNIVNPGPHSNENAW